MHTRARAHTHTHIVKAALVLSARGWRATQVKLRSQLQVASPPLTSLSSDF